MPANCVLNRMGVTDTNTTLDKLTEWERLLIPRAHAFQSIYVPRTASGARMPSNQCHRKQKGVTLFLPIPVEETLHNVLKDDEVFRTSHLRIAVRTGMGNKKVVFEDIVNIQSVYEALKSLKYTYKNPLYKDLPISETIDEFRSLMNNSSITVDEEESSTEIVISPEDDSNVLVSDDPNLISQSNAGTYPNPMLTQVTNEELEEYQNYYTVMPVDNQRKPNESSSLYKMNRVDGQPLRHYEVDDLDVRVHPTLFPDAKYGLNDPERRVPISETEYAKSRLRSKHPKFRQNKSYCFHLHHHRVMKQLSNGIYNTLNIQNFDSNLTNDELSKKIERGELDKNIATIFSQIRGTQEYLKIPRWNVETMLRNYGPATWFLTFSPTEWMWPRLKRYLLDCNPNLSESMTIAQLTSADPVGTAIFVEKKFQPFMKFLQGPTNPIGKVKDDVCLTSIP